MSPSTHHIIPESERYCIWMDAGVVDYKLCNCQFKCDECPFDAQVRTENRLGTQAGGAGFSAGSSVSAADVCAATLTGLLRSVERQALPGDRMYSPNHTWAKEADDGLCVLGIDHFVGAMLAEVHSVAFSVPPTRIKASEPYAWIVANGETLAVRSPIAGTIVENNHDLTGRSTVLHSDPYTNGWITKIRPDQDKRKSVLLPAERFTPAVRHDVVRLEESIRSAFHNLRPVSGASMYDGGTVLSSIEAMLGTKTIYEILGQFLGS